MKCPDCIHYEVCQSRITYDENYGDSTSFETRCGDFKDKSKFIESPCKIGETIYKIVTISCKNCNYDDTIQCSRRDRCPQTVERHSFSYVDIPWFGKKVFLTKEEAEKALKELNSK